MGKTVRRKNITTNEISGLAGTKQFGKLAQSVYNLKDSEGRRISSSVTYRCPSKKEQFKELQYRHGESSSADCRTPSRSYRRYRENRLRNFNKNALRNGLNESDYEVGVVYDNPASHYWDWS